MDLSCLRFTVVEPHDTLCAIMLFNYQLRPLAVSISELPDAYNEDEEHDSTQSTHDNDGLETDAHHSDSCQLDEQMEPDKPQQPMKAKCKS
jgi:hypothetical protein